ncbi:uncharacterized protein LOC105187996 [Harpegnathos saltator]|uniref:uncharacterized protein LOC105187996 n=1 Tax=Harpegnathos saltator TaxID=610380 RepID=UPI000DBEDA7B|nr:uncharacterized protein LOC105187996 [Harpegnathos saltator]
MVNCISPETQVLVNGVHIRVGPTIKYLGLTLDNRWSFGPHFRQLAPRMRKTGLAVASLMRAQRGPDWRAHRLYMSAVLSIALYGTPIWALQLLASGSGKRWLRQALRPVMIRAIRGFRTISYVKEFRDGGDLSAKDLKALRLQARARTLERWEDILSDPRGPGLVTAEAVRPCLSEFSMVFFEQKLYNKRLPNNVRDRVTPAG